MVSVRNRWLLLLFPVCVQHVPCLAVCDTKPHSDPWNYVQTLFLWGEIVRPCPRGTLYKQRLCLCDHGFIDHMPIAPGAILVSKTGLGTTVLGSSAVDSDLQNLPPIAKKIGAKKAKTISKKQKRLSTIRKRKEGQEMIRKRKERQERIRKRKERQEKRKRERRRKKMRRRKLLQQLRQKKKLQAKGRRRWTPAVDNPRDVEVRPGKVVDIHSHVDGFITSIENNGVDISLPLGGAAVAGRARNPGTDKFKRSGKKRRKKKRKKRRQIDGNRAVLAGVATDVTITKEIQGRNAAVTSADPSVSQGSTRPAENIINIQDVGLIDKSAPLNGVTDIDLVHNTGTDKFKQGKKTLRKIRGKTRRKMDGNNFKHGGKKRRRKKPKKGRRSDGNRAILAGEAKDVIMTLDGQATREKVEQPVRLTESSALPEENIINISDVGLIDWNTPFDGKTSVGFGHDTGAKNFKAGGKKRRKWKPKKRHRLDNNTATLAGTAKDVTVTWDSKAKREPVKQLATPEEPGIQFMDSSGGSGSSLPEDNIINIPDVGLIGMSNPVDGVDLIDLSSTFKSKTNAALASNTDTETFNHVDKAQGNIKENKRRLVDGDTTKMVGETTDVTITGDMQSHSKPVEQSQRRSELSVDPGVALPGKNIDIHDVGLINWSTPLDDETGVGLANNAGNDKFKHDRKKRRKLNGKKRHLSDVKMTTLDQIAKDVTIRGNSQSQSEPVKRPRRVEEPSVGSGSALTEENIVNFLGAGLIDWSSPLVNETDEGRARAGTNKFNRGGKKRKKRKSTKRRRLDGNKANLVQDTKDVTITGNFQSQREPVRLEEPSPGSGSSLPETNIINIPGVGLIDLGSLHDDKTDAGLARNTGTDKFKQGGKKREKGKPNKTPPFDANIATLVGTSKDVSITWDSQTAHEPVKQPGIQEESDRPLELSGGSGSILPGENVMNISDVVLIDWGTPLGGKTNVGFAHNTGTDKFKQVGKERRKGKRDKTPPLGVNIATLAETPKDVSITRDGQAAHKPAKQAGILEELGRPLELSGGSGFILPVDNLINIPDAPLLDRTSQRDAKPDVGLERNIEIDKIKLKKRLNKKPKKRRRLVSKMAKMLLQLKMSSFSESQAQREPI